MAKDLWDRLNTFRSNETECYDLVTPPLSQSFNVYRTAVETSSAPIPTTPRKNTNIPCTKVNRQDNQPTLAHPKTMAESDQRVASGSRPLLPETEGLAKTVASHYNNIEERGAQFRKESPIYYMRNLNNWIKSQLINQYTRKIELKKREKGESPGITVLDLGCGKGGDLLKWQKARVDHVVCCDIAGLSVEQCQDRYEQNRRRFDTFHVIYAFCQ